MKTQSHSFYLSAIIFLLFFFFAFTLPFHPPPPSFISLFVVSKESLRAFHQSMKLTKVKKNKNKNKFQSRVFHLQRFPNFVPFSLFTISFDSCYLKSFLRPQSFHFYTFLIPLVFFFSFRSSKRERNEESDAILFCFLFRTHERFAFVQIRTRFEKTFERRG